MEPCNLIHNGEYREHPFEIGDEVIVEFEWMEAHMYPSGHTEVTGDYYGDAVVTHVNHDPNCWESTIVVECGDVGEGCNTTEHEISVDQIILNLSTIDSLIHEMTQL